MLIGRPIEHLLAERPLFARVKEKYRRRAGEHVELVDFRPEHAEAFKALNLEWIERYFEVEETDRHQLDHPREVIIDPGGHIVMALYRGEVVGTCALIRAHDEWELAKMAVSPEARASPYARANIRMRLDLR